MPRAAIAAVLAAGLASAAPPALAQEIPQREARAIAIGHGMEVIDSIAFDDGRWRVEGRDIQGRELEFEIDAKSGLIVEIED